MSTTKEKKRQRKLIKALSTESVWLQKALFALQKAETAHEKLQSAQKGDDEPWVLRTDDREYPVEEVQEAMENRISSLLEEVKEQRRANR